MVNGSDYLQNREIAKRLGNVYVTNRANCSQILYVSPLLPVAGISVLCPVVIPSPMTLRLLFVRISLLISLFAGGQSSYAQRTENVVLVTLDGVRWQEVFAGADSTL